MSLSKTKINLEIDEDCLRSLVIDHLSSILNLDLSSKDVSIEVKSKQNYRSEWEPAQFRAKVEKTV